MDFGSWGKDDVIGAVKKASKTKSKNEISKWFSTVSPGLWT
jgi:hypothetical protein